MELLSPININQNRNTSEGEELLKIKGNFVMRSSSNKTRTNLGLKSESFRRVLELDFISQ